MLFRDFLEQRGFTCIPITYEERKGGHLNVVVTERSKKAVGFAQAARIGREMHRLTVELLGADERRPGVREAVQATLDLLRGLGVANLLGDDSPRRDPVLAAWKRQLAAALHS